MSSSSAETHRALWKSIRLQRTDGSWDEYSLEGGAQRVELRDEKGLLMSLGTPQRCGSGGNAQAQNLPRAQAALNDLYSHQIDSLAYLYSGTASEDLAQRLRSQWCLAFPRIVDSWKARGFGFPNHRIDPSQSQAWRAYHSIDPGFVGGDETVVSITPNTTFRQLQGTEINEKVSEAHRADPRKRHWETSYTKRIVDQLKILGAMKFWQTSDQDTFRRAIELLTDYHKTMHVPYEARDSALGRLKTLRVRFEWWVKRCSEKVTALDVATKENARLSKRVVDLTAKLNRIIAATGLHPGT